MIVFLSLLVFVQVIWCLARCTTCSVCAPQVLPSALHAQPISLQCPGPRMPSEHSTTSCPVHIWNHWRIPTWSLRLWCWAERGVCVYLCGQQCEETYFTLFFWEMSEPVEPRALKIPKTDNWCSPKWCIFLLGVCMKSRRPESPLLLFLFTGFNWKSF